MIITFIFIIMVLLGFIIIKRDIGDEPDITGGFIGGFGFVCLIISLIIIIATQATANHTVQQNKINYEGLCKRYEIVKSEYEDISKSDIIADITAWNMEVYNTKYWTENLWTNWFNPKKIADNLYYIPLEEERSEEE